MDLEINEESLNYEVKKRIAYITINRPHAANSLDAHCLLQIPKLLDEINKDRKVRCVVFQSAGEKNFSGGLDLKMIQSLGDKSVPFILENGIKVTKAVMKCIKPTVACIQGNAIGWGTMLFLNCDFRIVADKPEIRFALPEIEIGMFPGTGALLLPLFNLGAHKARELLLLRKRVGIDYMREIINLVVPPEDLEAATLDFLKPIRRFPADDLMQLTKSVINISGRNLALKTLEIEAECVNYAVAKDKPPLDEFIADLWAKNVPSKD